MKLRFGTSGSRSIQRAVALPVLALSALLAVETAAVAAINKETTSTYYKDATYKKVVGSVRTLCSGKSIFKGQTSDFERVTSGRSCGGGGGGGGNAGGKDPNVPCIFRSDTTCRNQPN